MENTEPSSGTGYDDATAQKNCHFCSRRGKESGTYEYPSAEVAGPNTCEAMCFAPNICGHAFLECTAQCKNAGGTPEAYNEGECKSKTNLDYSAECRQKCDSSQKLQEHGKTGFTSVYPYPCRNEACIFLRLFLNG